MKKVFVSFLTVTIVLLLIGMNFISLANVANDATTVEIDYNYLDNPDFGITMDKAIGGNSTIDDTKRGADLDEVFGCIREYHNLHWNLDNKDKAYSWYFWNGYWDFDNYYGDLYKRGVVVFPCIQGSCRVMSGNWGDQNRCHMKNADPLKAESYKKHGEYMFQYAARYGFTKVDDSLLEVADGQEKKSGLGYITYYENNNEPDKTWQGDGARYSPQQFAAMCSADYDGDEGRLGNNVGIKNADTNAKLVMGGIAGGSACVQWLEGMKEWFETNRTDKKMAFDVINFHSYVGNTSPEDGGYAKTLQTVTAWRNKYARDKEVWITEFGWDSAQGSTIAAPNNETARDWLLRSYLIGARSGIDRQTMYMLLSPSSETDNVHYMSSGLATKDGVKKPAWFSIYALKNILTNYKFAGVLQEDEDMYIYKFTNTLNNKEIFAFWSPTKDGTIIKDHKVKLDGRNNANLIKIVNNEINGVVDTLSINNDLVSFDVGETPVFLEVDAKKEETNTEENTVTNEVVENNTVEENTISNEVLENNTIEENTITNEVVENNTVEENTITNEVVESNTVEENTISNEVVVNNTIEENTVTNEIVENNTVEENTTINETTNNTDNKGIGIIDNSNNNDKNNKNNITKLDPTVKKDKNLPKTGDNNLAFFTICAILILLIANFIVFTKMHYEVKYENEI